MSQPGGPGQYPGGYGPPAGAPAPRKAITGSPETMALHAMSIDPRTGLPLGEKPPASTAAVIALVCGILICLGPLTGVPAIVAGFVARGRARQRPEAVGGAGMATAAIVLGFVNLVLWTIGVVIYVLSLAA